LTVRRNAGGDYRIFTIRNGTSDGPFVSIRGLTIAKWQGSRRRVSRTMPAAGSWWITAVLELQYCALTGNQSAIGGAILINETIRRRAVVGRELHPEW
jgi:hypothetical protein